MTQRLKDLIALMGAIFGLFFLMWFAMEVVCDMRETRYDVQCIKEGVKSIDGKLDKFKSAKK